jgi:hypothetical protein
MLVKGKESNQRRRNINNYFHKLEKRIRKNKNVIHKKLKYPKEKW